MDSYPRAFQAAINRVNQKRLIRLVGTSTVAVSLFFIGHRLWAQARELEDWSIGADLVIATAIGGFIYAGACLFLSSSWRRLLHLFADIRIPAMVAGSLYARSQIAKYVPGNVLHIAARHVFGRDLGLPHGALVLSTLGEMVGLTLGASTLGFFAAMIVDLGEHNTFAVWAGTASLLAVGSLFLGMPLLLRWLRRSYPEIRSMHPDRFRRDILAVLFRYFFFFLISGSVLVLLIAVHSRAIGLVDAASALLVFAVGWLAGFLTPGAPAGIGVREAVMVLALDGLGLGTQVLPIVLLFRIATLCGDVLFALFFLRFSGVLWKKPGRY